jgi:L-ribulokinase
MDNFTEVPDMGDKKYSVGVDYGTESGRAVLVDVSDGRVIASAVHLYANGVIDDVLPGTDIRLEPDWALQDPNDYIEVLKQTVPAVLQEGGVAPEDVIGVGVDFTACTVVAAKADGTPLCFLPEWRDNPHAWIKLWKHHAAQPEANQLNEKAREMGQDWLDRYGGKISSEWFFPKVWQTLDEAPDVYAADRLPT